MTFCTCLNFHRGKTCLNFHHGKTCLNFHSRQVGQRKMPRGGNRSCVEKKKRSEDEELERVFLQVELSQSPSKQQRGGKRNQGCSSSSLRSPCRVSQAVEEQKSDVDWLTVVIKFHKEWKIGNTKELISEREHWSGININVNTIHPKHGEGGVSPIA